MKFVSQVTRPFLALLSGEVSKILNPNIHPFFPTSCHGPFSHSWDGNCPGSPGTLGRLELLLLWLIPCQGMTLTQTFSLGLCSSMGNTSLLCSAAT